MPHPKWIGRWLLILTYILTAALVDAGHRHGAVETSASHCQSACWAPGAHLSGHASPVLERATQDCPACHFRSLSTLLPPVSVGLVIVPRLETASADAQISIVAEISTPGDVRAPPRQS